MPQRPYGRFILSCFLLLTLILTGLVTAQDGSVPADPVEEATTEVTEAPVIEETPKPESTPTPEISTEPTLEPTPEPTTEPITEPPGPPVETPIAPPDGAFADDFQDGDAAGWTLSAGWQIAAEANGNLYLSAAGPNESAAIDHINWAHLLLTARLNVSAGGTALVAVRAGAGSYQVVLDGAGQAALYRSGALLAQGAFEAKESAWRTLNLQALGGLVTIGVDGVVLFSYSDPAPLAEGSIIFGSGPENAGTVGIDDVQIIRLEAPLTELPPVIAELPPPADLPAPTDLPPTSDVQIIGELDGQALFGSSGFGRKPRIANLSSDLDALVQAWESSQSEALSLAAALGVETSGDRVMVTIIMNDLAQADAAVNALPGLGAEVTARYEYWIDASVPVGALAAVAALPGVNVVRPLIEVYPVQDAINNPPGGPFPAEIGQSADISPVGAYLTQGVAASNASAWHSAGWYGQGVNIAIIDSFQAYASAQAAGELPSSITIYGTLSTSSPHGTAVAEIIHDMAPAASLTFGSPNSAVSMANMIVALAAAGNDIISSSMGYYNAEAGDGIGLVSSAITTAYQSYGTLYVQAAGNQARYNWQGPFRDGDRDRFMNFTTSAFSEVNILNGATPVVAGWPLFINLRWNDWNATRTGNQTGQDYDLHIVRWTGSGWTIVASSVANQALASVPPTEQIFYVAPVTAIYGIVIERYNATGNHIMDLMGHNAPRFQFNMPARSLVDPATNPNAFGVAALNALRPYTLEGYSSRGPALGPGGTLAAGPKQPWIAAYANVDTWAYGLGVFNGTSSATPHVSGAAALVWSAFPNYTAAQVRTFLQNRAIDMGPAGYDTTYGRGRLNLRAAPYYPAPVLLLPRSGAVLATNLPYFEWRAASFGGRAPSGYFIQIDNNSNFSSPERWETVPGLNATLAPGFELPNGVYYWRVCAVNINICGRWSARRSFRVAVP